MCKSFCILYISCFCVFNNRVNVEVGYFVIEVEIYRRWFVFIVLYLLFMVGVRLGMEGFWVIILLFGNVFCKWYNWNKLLFKVIYRLLLNVFCCC